jgi:hypothetical protein
VLDDMRIEEALREASYVGATEMYSDKNRNKLEQ